MKIKRNAWKGKKPMAPPPCCNTRLGKRHLALSFTCTHSKPGRCMPSRYLGSADERSKSSNHSQATEWCLGKSCQEGQCRGDGRGRGQQPAANSVDSRGESAPPQPIKRILSLKTYSSMCACAHVYAGVRIPAHQLIYNHPGVIRSCLVVWAG